MIARACRSASKRATTWRVSMPGLRILRATLRRTGWVCSAMKTTPKPPSPICSKSLYGPITVPGRSAETAISSGTGAGSSSARRSAVPASRWAAKSTSTRRRRSGWPAQAWSRKAGHLRGQGILAGQESQGLVEVQESVRVGLGYGFGLREVDAPVLAAVLLGPLAAGVLDQDAAHGLGRRGDEVAATVPVLGLVAA